MKFKARQNSITALIQARMSSSRLPKKVLLPLGGKTVLENVAERVKKAKSVSDIIVVTSNDQSDDPIEELCRKKKIKFFRGELEDVLARFYQAATHFNLQNICRITADCPLVDPDVIDLIAEKYFRGNYDYAAVNRPLEKATYPDGLDAEIFSLEALKKAWQEAKLKSEREHVTPYIWKNPKNFKIAIIKNSVNFSKYRFTLDESADYEFIKAVYDKVRPLATANIIKFVDKNKKIKKLNSHIARDEGYLKSLKKDAVLPNVGKSRLLWKKAKKLIPGGTQLLSKRPEMFLPENWPAYFKSENGIRIKDLDGNEYFDFSYMAIGACALGYADQDVNSAVKKVIDQGSLSTLNSPEEVELAELLLQLHPWAKMARYARTGGEAMAVAVRIARAYSGKDQVAFCGYHGWSDWYLSSNLANEKNLDGQLLPGLDPAGVSRGLQNTNLPFHYNNLKELENLVKRNDIGVIVMEPIRHQEPKNDFLKKVRAIADKIGAVLIFDEVSSGWRLKVGGAHLLYGVNPDIAVFGKAMSNGYPMSAIIGKDKVMQAAQKTFISSTYWTERIGPAAALATIKKMKEKNVPKHLDVIGKMIGAGWKRLAKKHNLKIKIIGPNPLITFSFEYPDSLELKTLFTQEMLKRGFLAALTVYVSYAHTKDYTSLYLNSVDEVFRIIKNAIQKNKVKELLEGPVVHAGFSRLT